MMQKKRPTGAQFTHHLRLKYMHKVIRKYMFTKVVERVDCSLRCKQNHPNNPNVCILFLL